MTRVPGSKAYDPAESAEGAQARYIYIYIPLSTYLFVWFYSIPRYSTLY